MTEPREHHITKKRRNGQLIAVGDIVTVFEDKIPRQRWRIGRVEKLLTSNDGETRVAAVRVCQGGEKTITIRRPVKRFYPVEIAEEKDTAEEEEDDEPTIRFVADGEAKSIIG